MERMALGLQDLKLATGAEAEAGVMSFAGYGAAFGNTDAHGDVLEAGAFSDTLAAAEKSGHWPAMLMQHGGWGIGADDMTPIGIWTSLSEDKRGLKVEGKLADTLRGRETYSLLKMTPRPAITGLSIGYIPRKWESGDGKAAPRRTLKAVDLIEVSLVTFPANGRARVSSVKSLEDIASLADAETFLREAGGLSRAAAVAFIARVKAATTAQGEPAAALADVRELGALVQRNLAVLRRCT